MGNYVIVNCQSNGSLSVPQSNDPGKQCFIDQGGYGGSSWKIMPSQGQGAGKGYCIRQANGPFCLDAEGGSINEGTSIIAWLTENKPNQTWNILPA